MHFYYDSILGLQWTSYIDAPILEINPIVKIPKITIDKTMDLIRNQGFLFINSSKERMETVTYLGPTITSNLQL